MANADRFFDSGQYDKAEIEYLNVMQAEQLNARAIARLGIIYFEQGRLVRVMPLLLKARELQPDNVEVRLKLGLAHLATGKLKEAREEANFVLDHRPQDAEAPLLLVEASIKPEEIAMVRERLAKLSVSAADGVSVLVAQGMIDLRQNNLEGAASAFNRALSLNPKSSLVQSAMGSLYMARKEFQRAEQALKIASDSAPARNPRKLLHAKFKIQNGEIATARKMLEEITAATPDYLPAWMLLANLTMAEKRLPDTAAIVSKVLAQDPSHLDALLLNARIKLEQGEKEKAVADLERLVGFYPQSAQAQFHLAMAYVASGDRAKAAGSLNQAISVAPGFAEAVLLLADINFQRGDFLIVRGALEPLVQQRPDLVQAWFVLASAYRGLGETNRALAVYRQMEKLFPQNPQPALLAGVVLAQQNKRDEARQTFNAILEKMPDFLPAVEQLIDFDLAEKNYTSALQRVDAQLGRNPGLPGLHLLQAKIFMDQKDPDGTERALLKEIELQPDTPAAYFLLARLYVETNRLEKALANLLTVVAKHPKNTGALMLVGTIYDEQKNFPAAREAYEKVLAINSRFSSALNNLAYLYSEQFDLQDKAQELAQKARELQPHEPHMADTLGWILFKKRQYSWALSLLEESADKLPDAADVRFHLGMTRYMLGEEEAAREALETALKLDKDLPASKQAKERLAMLATDVSTINVDRRDSMEKALAETPDDPVALVRLAAIFERTNDFEKAAGLYQTALRQNPRNARAALRLIRLYDSRGDTAKAVEVAKAAHKVVPDDQDITQILGRLTFQAGDFQYALSLLRETARRQPGNPDALFDFARASYSVGLVPEAVAAMKAAIQTGIRFPGADEARRFLEMTSGVGSEPAQRAAALANIEQVLKVDATYGPALMALAMFKERDGDASLATEIYFRVLSGYPDFAPAKRHLAVLLSKNPASSQQSYGLAVKAREVFPNDHELARAFGIILFHRKEYGRAANLLQESTRSYEQDAETWYYLGMANLRLKKWEESKQYLRRALELGLAGDAGSEARRVLTDPK